MKFRYLNLLTLCLVLLLGTQHAFGQRVISEDISKNRVQIENTEKFAPLKAVNSDNIAEKISTDVLEEVAYFDIKTDQFKSIKQDKNAFLRMEFPISGQNVELQLTKAEIFSPNFRAVASSNPNKNLNIDRGVHYWGIVKDDPNSLVTVSLVGNELVASVNFQQKQYSLAKQKNSKYHILFENSKFKHDLDFSCDALPINDNITPGRVPTQLEKSSAMMDCVGIHMEIDRTVYQDNGSSIANTTNYVNALFAQMATLYTNESIQVAISFLKIWDTPDPYGAGTELNDLTSQGFGTTNGNVVHLLHANGGGGVAYLSGLCSNTFNTGVSNIFSFFNNVPTYSWDVEVFTHEIGHNLGSPHTHACAWNGNNTAIDGCGPASGNDEGCNPGLPPAGTIMSYCHLVGGVGIDFSLGFGQQPGDLIRSVVAANNCGNFCSVVCPAQVTSQYSDTEDVCAGLGTYTLPTTYTGLVVDNTSAANYRWSTGNYISAGGTAYTGTTYTLNNPAGCAPVQERIYLNVGCTDNSIADIDAGFLTLNIYPDATQFTDADLVTVSNTNTCSEPVVTPNCAGVTVTADAANPSFPITGNSSGVANYTVSYVAPAGTPDCCATNSAGAELVTNGNFESGTTGWTETEEVPTGTTNPNPFGIIGVSNGALNGSNDAWFGGWGGTSRLTLSQNITIPASCAEANLVFDYGMTCANGGVSLAVQVNGITLGTLTCTADASGTIAPFDLIAAGAPTGNVTFSLVGEEDGTGTDNPDIYIDNVSIQTANCSTANTCEVPVQAAYACTAACATVDLSINFDGFPSQTGWTITDASNNVMLSGSGVGMAGNSNMTDNACLFDGCYTLQFTDAIGNGMCPFKATAASSGIFITPGTFVGSGNLVASLGSVVAPGLCGNYVLRDANGTVIASGGGGFGANQTSTFCLNGGVAPLISEEDNSAFMKTNDDMAANMTVYPSLVNDVMTVSHTIDAMAIQFSIVDMNGRVIRQDTMNDTMTQLNVSDLEAGIYFVQLVANDRVFVQKFVKQ